ncbi:MAG: cyclic nucleotide-binding domain-containing protein [Methylacidiphilales bacterium]|nr:cyclic nucleotide-binding domain-containing protein [Candidatus Methylacidiphilales bacterium]
MEDVPESSPVPSPVDGALPEGWEELPPPLPPLGILAGLSDRSLENLASYGRYDKRNPGDQIITEGELQDRFYVVVLGKLAISASAGGKEIPLSVAEVGECIGEVSLLEPGPASATVKVVETATLWSMNLEDLRSYLSEHAGGGGALLMGMASCLSQRLRQVNQLIGKHHVVPVEILPRGRERAITAENTPVQIGFFDRLKKSLGGGEKKVKISTEIKM